MALTKFGLMVLAGFLGLLTLIFAIVGGVYITKKETNAQGKEEVPSKNKNIAYGMFAAMGVCLIAAIGVFVYSRKVDDSGTLRTVHSMQFYTL